MVVSQRGQVLLTVLIGVLSLGMLAVAVAESTAQLRYWSAVRAQRVQVEAFAEVVLNQVVEAFEQQPIEAPLNCESKNPEALYDAHHEALQQQAITHQFESLSARVLTVANCARSAEDRRWPQRAVFIQIDGPNQLRYVWLAQYEQRVW